MVTYEKIIRLSGVLTAIILVHGNTYADDVWEEWVAIYDPDNPESAETSDMVIDNEGNVYVTGAYYYPPYGFDIDYCTVKYDEDGNEEWVAFYDDTITVNKPSALAVDNEGYVYVTGISESKPDEYDYCTIKYDAGNGKEVWIAKYSYGDSYGGRASDITVDKTGHVYVTGRYAGVICTVRYDREGSEIWAKSPGDWPEGYYGGASAVAVDDEGYVYVSGWCSYYEQLYGIAVTGLYTIKYDSDGNEIWSVITDETLIDESSVLTDLRVDEGGNVYVSGGPGTYKYDGNGNKLWGDASYVGFSNIAIDNYGNVFTTGLYGGDYVTIKYDTDGNMLWFKTYDGPAEGDETDWSEDVATDNRGNAYVTGYSEADEGPGGGPYDICTIKYDADGNEMWVIRFDGPMSKHDGGKYIAVDGRYVYVNGFVSDGCYNYCTIKYAQGITNSPPNPFDLLAPPNGDTVSNTPTLDWEDSTDDDGDTVTYDAWYATNPSFDPHDEVSDITDSSYTFPEGVLTQGETYYWKIRAWDGYEGTWSGPDEYWSFTVENEPPGDFDLTAPPDGSIVIEPITLDWEDSIDPGRTLTVGAGSSRTSADTGLSKSTRSITYDVWYAAVPSFEPHDEVTELTDSTYTFPEGVLSDGTTYYWKVRAWDGWDETWSGPDPYWSFTVDNELDVPVAGFSAENARDGVELTWECADPGVGFNLYRSEEATGVRSKLRETLNAELIVGKSPYNYLDADVSDGVTYAYWLEAIDAGGDSETFGPVSCTAGTFVPGSYALYQSRPNPARGTAVIAFDLPEDTAVTLTVYDLSGRKVTTLVNETLPAGAHERSVAGLAPGVYVYRLAAGEFSAVGKMVVIN